MYIFESQKMIIGINFEILQIKEEKVQLKIFVLIVFKLIYHIIDIMISNAEKFYMIRAVLFA